jgi:hypothetical protein
METVAVVWYRGALAYYSVSKKEDGSFVAALQKYAGPKEDNPPRKVRFAKQGRHCTGDTEEQELMDEICSAVEQQTLPPIPPPGPSFPYHRPHTGL